MRTPPTCIDAPAAGDPAGGPLRVVLLADTHLPRRGPLLPRPCLERLRGADLIVHAGDLSDLATLGMLRSFGCPVVAVRGNVEEPAVRAALPETAQVQVGGVAIGVVHDAGPEAGRPTRLRRRFPTMDVVVFGHSHIPLHHTDAQGLRIINPGSPTDRRRQPHHSMAEMLIGPASRRVRVDFWCVDAPGGPLDPALVRG